MLLSLTVLTILQSTPPEISIIDSRDDAKSSYVIVNNCKVKIKKTELNDFDALLEKVNKACNLNLKKEVE